MNFSYHTFGLLYDASQAYILSLNRYCYSRLLLKTFKIQLKTTTLVKTMIVLWIMANQIMSKYWYNHVKQVFWTTLVLWVLAANSVVKCVQCHDFDDNELLWNFLFQLSVINIMVSFEFSSFFLFFTFNFVSSYTYCLFFTNFSYFIKIESFSIGISVWFLPCVGYIIKKGKVNLLTFY